MIRNYRLGVTQLLSLLIPLIAIGEIVGAEKPNVVLILCDDLGYGDVGAYNPQCKIKTPNIDRLATEGVRFTDAHSCSAVCTPTRYALLTGRYNWRSRLQNGVLGGLSPRLIEPGMVTIADMLRDQGYTTACLGKWHLGLDWQKLDAKTIFGDVIERGEQGWQVDFNKPFNNGPLTVGFDYYFGISASLDMVPYTFLENDRVEIIPTIDKDFPLMLGKKNGGRTRKGPTAKEFDADQVLPRLTGKAVELIDRWSADSKSGKPFFLYMPLASPHTPIVPLPEWQNKSGLNPYADFVMQTDHAIGQVLEAIARNGLTENTLVIVTSDNGCSPQADFKELAKFEHNPSYIYRGQKADIFEGGHRVPYVARWPKSIKAGTTCDQLVGLQDTMATCADILDIELSDATGVDSFSWLPHLSGSTNSTMTIRESLVHHSINGSFAIRRGKWKLCFCPDSGGWSEPRPNAKTSAQLPTVQLFDLEADPGEQANVAETNRDVVVRLTDEMQQLIDRGRSTTGQPQANTVNVKWNSRRN